MATTTSIHPSRKHCMPVWQRTNFSMTAALTGADSVPQKDSPFCYAKRQGPRARRYISHVPQLWTTIENWRIKQTDRGWSKIQKPRGAYPRNRTTNTRAMHCKLVRTQGRCMMVKKHNARCQAMLDLYIMSRLWLCLMVVTIAVAGHAETIVDSLCIAYRKVQWLTEYTLINISNIVACLCIYRKVVPFIDQRNWFWQQAPNKSSEKDILL